MRVLIGLIVAGIGFLMVWKTDWIVRNFGYMAWAERSMGIFGGTRTVIKVIAVIGIFFGFLYMTNQLDGFLDFVFGWILPEALKNN